MENQTHKKTPQTLRPSKPAELNRKKRNRRPVHTTIPYAPEPFMRFIGEPSKFENMNPGTMHSPRQKQKQHTYTCSNAGHKTRHGQRQPEKKAIQATIATPDSQMQPKAANAAGRDNARQPEP